jgi:hypothetical protein
MHFTVDTYLSIAGIILGSVALVMAIPPLFQMLYGRPKLTFEADDFTGPDGRILVIAIKNQPIKSRLLLLLGVEREPGDVQAFFDIQEQGTGKLLVGAASGLLQCAPMRTMGLLVRSLPGFSVGLTVIGTREGKAHFVNARAETENPIGPGHYIARIAIVRGQHTYNINQTFTVGTEDHMTFWDDRNVVTIRR